ncbi:hypothetical protein GCM10025876_34090 [Demequina litorisediminis]|uniref:Aminotransferase class I/classII large domain-containing protein n=1 Tax=Demequina litorisediminis TaxID=1849022 RepID=A0ABQ6IHD5_9MICO|nr:hypothetical protein GCM10025876_34090 [Demequina litorisediminis]
MTLPLRPDLAGLEPYGAPQLAVAARLNVNENPYSPPPVVVDAITQAVRKAAEGLNRYPDRDFTLLRQDLAAYLAAESYVDFVEARNIWAANGSNEVMLHLHQAFGGPGRKIMSFAPTYSMYPEYARDSLTEYIAVPRNEDFSIDIAAATAQIREQQPSLVIVASPNNPTGTALSLDEVRELYAATEEVEGGCVLVIDEAYAEFRRAWRAECREHHPHAPQPRGEPHHVQGVRARGRAPGLLGGTRAGHRCPASGASPVSPERRDTGGGACVARASP